MYHRNNTQSFAPYSDYPEVYIDLYQFANFVANNTDYTELKDAALNLMSSITIFCLILCICRLLKCEGILDMVP